MEAAAPSQQTRFRWASGFSEADTLSAAVDEAVGPVKEGLGGAAPDLVLAFASPSLGDDLGEVPAALVDALSPEALLGTTGAGVIGSGHEAEGRPALALLAGTLPGVHVAPFHVDAPRLSEMDIRPSSWRHFLGVPPEATPHFLLLVHPFTLPVDALVTALDQAFPRSRKVGGLSSGGQSPDTMAVFLGDRAYADGGVGVALWGDVDLDVIVAQGCRPVGPAMKVTKAAGPDLFELDGTPALARVVEVLRTLPEEDRELAQHSLFVGVALEAHEKEGQETYDGGYLIRNIMGADPGSNVLRVGHTFHDGQTVRLQLREAETAREDLTDLLARYQPLAPAPSDAAALLFSCTGRGVHLYGREGHDSELLRDALGPLPLAGFFCNGEIGPVGEVTYVHGYTSSVGVLRPKGPEATPATG